MSRKTKKDRMQAVPTSDSHSPIGEHALTEAQYLRLQLTNERVANLKSKMVQMQQQLQQYMADAQRAVVDVVDIPGPDIPKYSYKYEEREDGNRFLVVSSPPAQSESSNIDVDAMRKLSGRNGADGDR
jgi:hypothetical protein